MADSKFPQRQEFMNALRRAFRTLEEVANLHVVDKDLSSPDGNESPGDIYILGSSPSGDWSSGSAGDLALWNGVDWFIIEPDEGFHAYVSDEQQFYVYNGTGWQQSTSTGSGASAETDLLIKRSNHDLLVKRSQGTTLESR